MTQPIDTSPARLKELARTLARKDCSLESVEAAFDALLALAAEKEAQAGKEPVADVPVHPSTEQTADQRIDAALESVLNAAGTSLKHYTMQRTLDQMREAMRKIMIDEWAEGTKSAFRAMNRHVDL